LNKKTNFINKKKSNCKKKQESSEVGSRVPWVNVFLVNTKQNHHLNYPDLVSFLVPRAA